MGGNVSRPTDTRLDTKEALKAIFDYLKSDLSINDLSALSTPSKCEKYVLFLADNMQKHFYQLRIFPAKNSRGILEFRTVEDHTKPTTEKEKQERQQLCLTLSFFYIRIFQIYGAIALTLIDDVDYMSKIIRTTTPVKKTQTTNTLRSPGQPGFSRQKGGGKTLYLFDFMETYLVMTSYNDNYGYKTKSTTDTYFMPNERSGSESQQTGTFRIQIDKIYTLTCTVTSDRFDTKTMRFNRITYVDGGGTITKEIQSLPISCSIKQKDGTFTIDNQVVSDYFNTFISNIVREVKSDGTKKSTTENSDKDIIIPELKLDALRARLTYRRPQAHCIARAMQLLVTKPIPNENSRTLICKTRFLEKNSEESRSGILGQDDKLDKSPGLLHLSRLFYDTISIVSATTPKITIGKENTIEQYNTFMKRMARRFGDETNAYGQQRDVKDYRAGIHTVKNKRDKILCDNDTDKVLSIPFDTAERVYTVVETLVKMQKAHQEKCNDILRRLFNVTGTPPNRLEVSLHHKLLEGGFDEIDKITYDTRELLIDYYSNCENTYLKGVQMILPTSTPNTSTKPTTNVFAPSSNIIGNLRKSVM